MRRQQAQANSRSFRALALPCTNASIGPGSLQASHSASVTAPPSSAFERTRRHAGRPPPALRLTLRLYNGACLHCVAAEARVAWSERDGPACLVGGEFLSPLPAADLLPLLG